MDQWLKLCLGSQIALREQDHCNLYRIWHWIQIPRRVQPQGFLHGGHLWPGCYLCFLALIWLHIEKQKGRKRLGKLLLRNFKIVNHLDILSDAEVQVKFWRGAIKNSKQKTLRLTKWLFHKATDNLLKRAQINQMIPCKLFLKLSQLFLKCFQSN